MPFSTAICGLNPPREPTDPPDGSTAAVKGSPGSAAALAAIGDLAQENQPSSEPPPLHARESPLPAIALFRHAGGLQRRLNQYGNRGPKGERCATGSEPCTQP